MTPLLPWDSFTIALAVSTAFLLGWIVHDYEIRRRMRHKRDEQRLARDVLANLHSLIDNVSADMDQHCDSLTEINENLTVSAATDSTLVATGS